MDDLYFRETNERNNLYSQNKSKLISACSSIPTKSVSLTSSDFVRKSLLSIFSAWFTFLMVFFRDPSIWSLLSWFDTKKFFENVQINKVRVKLLFEIKIDAFLEEQNFCWNMYCREMKILRENNLSEFFFNKLAAADKLCFQGKEIS